MHWGGGQGKYKDVYMKIADNKSPMVHFEFHSHVVSALRHNSDEGKITVEEALYWDPLIAKSHWGKFRGNLYLYKIK